MTKFGTKKREKYKTLGKRIVKVAIYLFVKAIGPHFLLASTTNSLLSCFPCYINLF